MVPGDDGISRLHSLMTSSPNTPGFSSAEGQQPRPDPIVRSFGIESRRRLLREPAHQEEERGLLLSNSSTNPLAIFYSRVDTFFNINSTKSTAFISSPVYFMYFLVFRENSHPVACLITPSKTYSFSMPLSLLCALSPEGFIYYFYYYNIVRSMIFCLCP